MEHPSSALIVGRALVRRLFESPTVRMVSAVSSGNLFATAIGLVVTLVQARFVGPNDLGYLRQFGILAGYAFWVDFGLWNALQRRYPLYIGQGRQDQAVAAAEICQAWSVSLALLAVVVSSTLTVAAFGTGNWRAGLAWMVQSVVLASSFYGGYLGATYRSGHDFTTAAKGSIISSVTGLFCLPFFPFWPYVALILRSSLGSLANLLYLHWRRPLRVRWRFRWREWFELAREGVPLFTAGYGATGGWAVVEATLILKCFGTRSLGLWSVGVTLLEMVNRIPQTIAAVYAPRLTEHFGRHASVRECMRICWKPMLWAGIGIAVFTAAFIPLIPVAVRILIPKYTEAIVPMSLMMLNLPLIMFDLPNNVLIATGCLIQQNVTVYFGMLCFVLLALAAVHEGWGLNGIVVASILGRMARMATTYWFIFSAVRREANDIVLLN